MLKTFVGFLLFLRNLEICSAGLIKNLLREEGQDVSVETLKYVAENPQNLLQKKRVEKEDENDDSEQDDENDADDEGEEMEESTEDAGAETANENAAPEFGSGCAVGRRHMEVDLDDATLINKSNARSPNWRACQWQCDEDPRCEAFTLVGEKTQSSWSNLGYCYFYKKTAEDAQWHKPVQFRSKQHSWAGYSGRCELPCGARESSKKYRGKTMKTVTVQTWEQCQDACETTSGCLTFSFRHAKWTQAHKFGKCMLKNRLKHRGTWDPAWSSGVPCAPISHAR